MYRDNFVYIDLRSHFVSRIRDATSSLVQCFFVFVLHFEFCFRSPRCVCVCVCADSHDIIHMYDYTVHTHTKNSALPMEYAVNVTGEQKKLKKKVFFFLDGSLGIELLLLPIFLLAGGFGFLGDPFRNGPRRLFLNWAMRSTRASLSTIFCFFPNATCYCFRFSTENDERKKEAKMSRV